jgi:prophage tail gpP-like protein
MKNALFWRSFRVRPAEQMRGRRTVSGICSPITAWVSMKISDHKTRAVFQRYNITSVEDVKQAMQRVSEHNAKAVSKGKGYGRHGKGNPQGS